MNYVPKDRCLVKFLFGISISQNVEMYLPMLTDSCRGIIGWWHSKYVRVRIISLVTFLGS